MTTPPEPSESIQNPPQSTVRRSYPGARTRLGIDYAEGVTLVDRLYQLGYRIGYQLVRLLWALLRPTTHGALVVVWQQGLVLLIRNSYVSYFSPPGGYVRGGETARMAAIRELSEETGLKMAAEELSLCHEETHFWEFRRDHVTMFDVEINEPVAVHVDHREVVSAGFYTPEQALSLNLFPPLRRRLEKYLSNRANAATG